MTTTATREHPKEQHRQSYTALYENWRTMVKRCENPNNAQYRNYGARGIRVCERWRYSFSAFKADVGDKPSPLHSLERKNNDGHYEPGNVRWATQTEQSRNTRRTRYLTLNGVTRCVTEWSELLGVSRSTLTTRLRRGWPIERVLWKGDGRL